MRRSLRILGTLFVVAGVLMLVWAVVVWRWQDPFTALYTKWQQRGLSSDYEDAARAFESTISSKSLAAERKSVAQAAKRYRLAAREGQPIGRLHVPRMDVNMIVVNVHAG
jgi:hypothetical protein